jgi:chromosome transmission fidelity protein 18
MVQSHGDVEQLMNTCFENYLKVNLFDVSGKLTSTESRFVQQGHYNIFFDVLQKFSVETQHFELQRYLAYPIINYHRLYASTVAPKIEYPRSFYTVDSVSKQVQTLAKSFWSGMTVYNQSVWSKVNDVILELAPFLLYIITPDFKPMNIQVLKKAERQILDRLVEILVSFGLHLVKETTDANTTAFALEPYDVYM